jgi:general secretion pathway protein D
MRQTGRTVFPWAAVFALFASPVHARQDSAPPASERVQVQVPDSLKLTRLIDLTAEITGQSFSYNAQELGTITVTLRVPGGLSPENLPALLDHVLSSRGFTTVRTQGSEVLSVVKMEQAAGIARVQGTDPGGTALAPGFITELVEVRHGAVKDLAEAVKLVLSRPGGTATPVGQSGLLALSDLAPRVEEAKALIKRLDVASDVVVREITLENMPAAQVIALATQLVSKRDVVAGGVKLAGDLVPTADGTSVLLVTPARNELAWREIIRTVDRREGVETRSYASRAFTAAQLAKSIETVGGASTAASGITDERFKVIPDEITGTVIVTGTANQHDRIADLVKRADSGEQVTLPIRTIAVRNRPVADVVQTLEQLISAGAVQGIPRGESRDAVRQGASQSSYRQPLPPPGTVGGDRTGPTPSPTTADQGANATQVRGDTNAGLASMTSDESTNTLILVGEPKVLDQIEALLKTIDVRQPQVMLEVLLVSLNDTEALSLGVELERLGSLGNASTQLSSIFGLTGGSAGARTVPDQAGFTGAVLNAGEFSVVVRALESINKGNSLSNPKLLVTNNERAVFSSTLQQPITQQTRTGSNDTTFSYGGSESAGTTISVQPQISQGDHLALTYSIKLSSFVGTSTTAGLPPPKQENSVDSSATIPDGHTVVVGGMELITESEAIAQVPILGSIPIIGELFKTRDRGSGRTRFYVFIRANVLRSGMLEDLKYISAMDIAKVQGLGGRIDDGFPEVKARVIR